MRTVPIDTPATNRKLTAGEVAMADAVHKSFLSWEAHPHFLHKKPSKNAKRFYNKCWGQVVSLAPKLYL